MRPTKIEVEMEVEDETKTCTGCERELPLGEFNKDRSGKHGRRSRCKACVREYAGANRERGTERMRAWRAANPERDLANRLRYEEENRDRLLERRRQYRIENPHKDWESDYRKRCRAAGQTPVVVSFTREELVDYWGNGEHCVFCNGPFEEIDHLFPVSLGGVHTVESVAPSCAACNRAGGRDVARFLRGMTEQERFVQVIVGAARARLALIA